MTDRSNDRAAQDRIDALEGQLADLQRQVAMLVGRASGSEPDGSASPVTAEQATAPRPATSDAPHAVTTNEADGADSADAQRIGRRRLFAGAAGAAAATALAIVADAEPAAAAGPISGTSAAATPAVRGDTANDAEAIRGNSTAGGKAVYGYATGTGVAGKFDVVNATSGAHAIDAYTSGTGAALFAHTEGDQTVILAQTQTATGFTTELPAAVIGDSWYTNGLVGLSVNRAGVRAVSKNSTAIEAEGGISGIEVEGGIVGIRSSSQNYPLIADGGRAQLRLGGYGGVLPVPPQTATFAAGPGFVLFDQNGDLWFCVAAGTPGTWRKLAGPAAAGALHVLPAPVRVYDSRSGTAPAVGPKTPLTANTARTVDTRANSSGVPAGATAVLATVLIVNATPGNANATLWAKGEARPAANTMVWGGSTGRVSTQAVTAIDSSGACQIVSSTKTDVVLDIVGYYL